MSRTLHIVKYQPNDYSLGEALFSPETTSEANHSKIESALSLYFQWPEHRQAVIYPTDGGSAELCELSFDQDDAEISFVFARMLQTPSKTAWKEGDEVRLRFEVFRTCFEIQATILGTSTQSSDGWDIVLSIPEQGTLYKHRRGKRYQVPKDTIESLQISLVNGERFDCTAIEVSCQSIVVRSDRSIEDSSSITVHWMGQNFQGVVVRNMDERIVIALDFSSGVQSGKFFDIYRQVAYPYLKRRNEVDSESVLELYERTGYIERYSADSDAEKRRTEILETWEQLKPAEHEYVADYVAFDSSGNMVGASGLAMSHFQNDIPVWFFNQLCAVTSPDLLEHSGGLYQWRLDYLMAVPSDIYTACRYRSKSRWLERIYTKFAHTVGTRATLAPIVTYQKNFSKGDISEKIEVKSTKLSNLTRYYFEEGKICGGFNPCRLNISTSMDAVFAHTNTADATRVAIFVSALLVASGKESANFAISIHPSAILPENVFVGQTDRLVRFEKENLADLMASIDHVLAVTKRKLRETAK